MGGRAGPHLHIDLGLISGFQVLENIDNKYYIV